MTVIEKMETENLDYCIGVRKRESHCDRNRRLGKFILSKIVNILAKEPVEDFNSGMRAFKRDFDEIFTAFTAEIWRFDSDYIYYAGNGMCWRRM